MNQRVAHSILQVLSVTEGGAPDTEFWRAFGPRDVARTLGWLDRSGLALYLRENLCRRNLLEELPADARTHLARRDTDNRSRVTAIARQFQALNRLFAKAGVEFAVLKGFSLVPDYCPDPVLRNQYDLDYLISPASRESAAQVLHQAGYQPKNSRHADPVVYRQLLPSADAPGGAVTPYSTHLARPVEIHHRLWDEEEDKVHIAELQGVWDRMVQREWQGLEFPSLSDEDGLLFQVLHAFHHVLRNWCRLSVFLEIATFLRQRFPDTGLWERFDERISNGRWLPEASGVIFSLTAKLFGAPIPPMLNSKTIAALPLSLTRWLERFGVASAINNFEMNKHSLFLHREFLDDPGDWVKIRRRRLFPLHLPPRPPGLALQPQASSAKRSLVRFTHLLRRIRFHLSSGLLYAWERTRQP